MGTLSGSPEAQVIIYAVSRGEYDQDLALIDKAIHQRRDAFDRLGLIQPSKGDWVEIWDEVEPTPDVKVPAAILGQKLQVIGFTSDKKLRCRVAVPFNTPRRSYARGAIVKVDKDWVYRVQYSP